MTTTRKTEVEAIRTLVNLHDPDTQPDEWRPEDHAAAEAAAHVLAGLLRRAERTIEAQAATKRRQAAQERPRRKPEPLALRRSREVVQERSRGRCEHPDGCEATAQVVHHRAGRVGKGAHDPHLLMHLCDDHHRWVHDHPAESYANGAMVRRSGIRPEKEI